MGHQLGRYTLRRRIGSGGMAEVFLAEERRPGGPPRVCVVKRAYPYLAENPRFVQMFLDEAALAAQLSHPNIAQIFDLGAVEGEYFIAMEYVPGFDLLTLVLEHERRGEWIPAYLAARIASQAADALHHAHTAIGAKGQPLQVIHRDVSPQNILLSTEGVVKLIDFGVAKANVAMHRTQTGMVKGKYQYMSPEQISGQPIDARTDIYALGLVLYELLTNTRALAGDTEVEVIESARRGRIAPVASLRPDVPDALRSILARCLQPTPSGRFSTAAELSDALERYVRSERRSVTPEDLVRLHRVVAADAYATTWDPGARPLEVSHSGLGQTLVSGAQRALAEEPEHGRATEQALPALGATEQALPALGDGPALPADRHLTLQNASAATEQAIPATKPSRGPLWIALGLAVVVAAVALLAVFHDAGSAAAPLPAPPPLEPAHADPADQPGPGPHDPAPQPGEAVVEEEPKAPKPARLRVRSEPTLQVLVNGKPFGRTPAELSLPPGKQVVELRDPRLGLSRRWRLTLAAGKTHVHEWKPQKGTLVVEVVPFGEIFVDGQKLTPKPVSFREIELWEGEHRVRVFSPQTQRSGERVVLIPPGTQRREAFNLMPE